MQISTFILRTFIIVATLCSTENAFGFITESRKFQLDSITTNIDKTIKKDLEKVHTFLHATGKNDEERVWMFYGFIATHFKYDYDRKNEKVRTSYSNGYTAKKMSGVCEDFAYLFKDLCDRSNIHCLVVLGKVPTGFFGFIDATKRIIRRKSNKTNHAWNVVKIDTAWKLMDPTWGSILRVEKRQIYDVKQKRNISVSVKIVNRKYYAADPEMMKTNHKAVHPAFYASPKVPTYKSALRKEKNRKVYQENYPFTAVLDTVFMNENPAFSKYLHAGANAYMPYQLLHYFLVKEFEVPIQKTAIPLTISDYEASLAHIKKLAKYIEDEHGIILESKVNLFEQQVNKKIGKLKRKSAIATKK